MQREKLGPFTGGQLTIVIVAIAAMFAIPTAALAASGAFTNNSATVPAVKGTNSNAKGIGVHGTGTKYGVYSNGPLGVATGKPLRCSGCVGPSALSASAKALQPLGSGQSESGVFGVGAGDSTSGQLVEPITFVRLVPYEPHVVYTYTYPVPHCSGPGHADPLYMCMYVTQDEAIEFGAANFASATGVNVRGAWIFWNVIGPGAFVAGTWTVTAA